ncbi:PilZ domain-containing protein [Nitrospinota bacterium]
MEDPKETRRYPRYQVPVEVVAPSLSDTPVLAENVSAGGFQVMVPNDPGDGADIQISFRVSGMEFVQLKALRAWSKEDESQLGMYHLGLLVLMTDTDRKRFLDGLENLVEME